MHTLTCIFLVVVILRALFRREPKPDRTLGGRLVPRDYIPKPKPEERFFP
jgi:hypothetical protein